MQNNGKNKKRNTYVAIILDSSGSMKRIKKEVVKLFNDQVVELQNAAAKGVDGNVKISLIPFATNVPRPIFWNVDVDHLKPISEDAYRPEGSTALLDATGLVIDHLRKVADINLPETQILVIIISDGLENASRKYSHFEIATRIEECESTGRWTFVYLGADLYDAEKLGIHNTLQFDADREGMTNASTTLSTATRAFMEGRKKGVGKNSKHFFN